MHSRVWCVTSFSVLLVLRLEGSCNALSCNLAVSASWFSLGVKGCAVQGILESTTSEGIFKGAMKGMKELAFSNTLLIPSQERHFSTKQMEEITKTHSHFALQ